jgi:2-polyprenyl-3-methyl-5-hydroxy-6-metoxy-1,4-benzoquinol methylase
MTMTEPGAPTPERTPDALVARLFEATLGAMDLMGVYVGDRLGLYRALAEEGPTTFPELAARAGIAERYAREWLEQQTATGILDVADASAAPAERLFSLPEAFVEPLTDLDSASSVTPVARAAMAMAAVMPQVVEAYRSGRGVDWDDFGPDMIEAQGDMNRPWLLGRFGTEILPALPDVHARLVADPPARVADVACGVGWAAIAIAKAYPGVLVDGFDLDPGSIELARRHAAAHGVEDRVSFAVRDAADPAAAGRYDVAVVIEAIHDLSQPVEVLSAIRAMLVPDGLLLVADEKTQEAFTGPGDELERIFYGFSAFVCLPAAMNDRPTAATGTVMRAATLAAYARAAGFAGFERVDEPALDMLRFYRLTPSPDCAD